MIRGSRRRAGLFVFAFAAVLVLIVLGTGLLLLVDVPVSSHPLLSEAIGIVTVGLVVSVVLYVGWLIIGEVRAMEARVLARLAAGSTCGLAAEERERIGMDRYAKGYADGVARRPPDTAPPAASSFN